MVQELFLLVLDNADPANAGLLVLIYHRLRSQHREAQMKIESVKERVDGLEGYHEGD